MGSHCVLGVPRLASPPAALWHHSSRNACDLVVTRLEVARLGAMLSDTEAPLIPPSGATSGATDGQIARARLPVVSQVAEHRAKLAQLDREQQQHDANRAAVAATVDKLVALLP